MVTAVLMLHLLVSILLILVVLIQGGENVDITAAFGGVSQAAFGPRGTVTTLAKITWVLGAIFVVTSITLAVTRAPQSPRRPHRRPPRSSSRLRRCPGRNLPLRPNRFDRLPVFSYRRSANPHDEFYQGRCLTTANSRRAEVAELADAPA
jgi:preprotein translocase subunit SecG